MVKPPLAIARMIASARHGLGISDGHDPERLHVTVMPLCDGRLLPPGGTDWFVAGLAGIDGQPFHISLDAAGQYVNGRPGSQ